MRVRTNAWQGGASRGCASCLVIESKDAPRSEDDRKALVQQAVDETEGALLEKRAPRRGAATSRGGGRKHPQVPTLLQRPVQGPALGRDGRRVVRRMAMRSRTANAAVVDQRLDEMHEAPREEFFKAAQALSYPQCEAAIESTPAPTCSCAMRLWRRTSRLR